MPEARPNLQRILLPLDLSRDSLAALDSAFVLAAALGAEVSGLFIEDERLVAAGNLPFAREVGSFSGIRRQIGCADIEHRFRAVAANARLALVEAGRERQVRSRFRVARGDVSGEIFSASGDADIVVLGKAGWSAGTIHKPGGTCRFLLSETRIPVMVVERGASFSPPILAVHDETAAGLRALEVARNLSSALKWDIAIFASRGMSTADQVLQRIHHDKKSHLVVLPCSLSLTECTSHVKCPVLFVP
jgi:hypothetical protein